MEVVRCDNGRPFLWSGCGTAAFQPPDNGATAYGAAYGAAAFQPPDYGAAVKKPPL